MSKHEIDIQLGDEVKDKITDFKGIVTVKSTYLNGCVRVAIQPKELKDGKPIDAHYFDVEQVEVVTKAKATMSAPSGGPESAPKRAPDPKR